MRRGLLLVVAGGITTMLVAPAGGSPADVHVARAADDAFALLEQAARAAQRYDYRGTQMVSFWSEHGSTSALIEVTHVSGEGLLLRVASTPQSPGGAVFDDEDGEVPDAVGFAKGTLALLARNYEVVVEGTGDVAGRRADIVAVRRPGSSPSARFWLDRQTRLPLRRDVLDTDGRTVRASAFLTLVVGDTTVSDVVQEQAIAMPVAAGNAVPTSDAERLRAAGWEVPERLPSGLELFESRLIGEGADAALQLSYSDGVSTVSVFEQRGRLDTASVKGWVRERVAGHRVWVQDAFPRRLVWSGRGRVFTVVAECPQAALADLVGALPHGNPGPSVGSRLGHGVVRVGSWLNPFA